MLQVRTRGLPMSSMNVGQMVRAAVYPGEHVPDYGSARRALPGRTFDTRDAAKAYCDRLNAVDLDDWKAR